jgi:hypothetical protein
MGANDHARKDHHKCLGDLEKGSKDHVGDYWPFCAADQYQKILKKKMRQALTA